MYEKLRFDRVRKCQRNGEDIRDRWHSALKKLEAGERLNPEDVMMRVILRFRLYNVVTNEYNRIVGCIRLMRRPIRSKGGRKSRQSSKAN